MTKKPSKKQVARAREYIREHEFEIRVHAICQLLGYTRKVRELERLPATRNQEPASLDRRNNECTGNGQVK